MSNSPAYHAFTRDGMPACGAKLTAVARMLRPYPWEKAPRVAYVTCKKCLALPRR